MAAPSPPSEENTDTLSVQGLTARSALRDWFHRPSTMGINIQILSAMYMSTAMISALLNFATCESALRWLNNSSGEIAFREALLFIAMAIVPIVLKIARNAFWGVFMFLLSFASLTLFYTATWISHIVYGSSRPCVDSLALLAILYIVGHGFRVIIAARRELLQENEEEMWRMEKDKRA